MKTSMLSAVLFLVGAIFGFQNVQSMMKWFASAAGLQMISLHRYGWILTCVLFSIGCGVLLGIAPILAAWAHPRRGSIARLLPYLLGGCLVSITVAIHYRWLFASMPLSELSADRPTHISIDAIPTLRLPLAGIVAMIVAASFSKALGGKKPQNQPP